MISKPVFNLFTLLFLLCLQAPAQEPVLSKLETGIEAEKKKLDSPGIDSVEREKIFTQIAYDLNQLAEIYFNKGEYETATRLFVEADAFTRRLHESTYARYRQQLAEHEAKLPEYAKEPNKQKRDILYNTGRIVISMLLSQVITEADFFNDEKNKKIYLERLVVISKENKDSKGEAKAYEKLGTVEINNDNTTAAFAYFEKALAIRRILKEEWWTYDYMAYAHWQLGQYDKAIDRFMQEIGMLREVEKITGDTTPISLLEKMTVRSSLASALFSLAQLRMVQGKYGDATKAILQVEDLLAVLQSGMNTSSDETVNALLTMTITAHTATLYRIQGRILEAQGRVDESMKKYADAIELFSQLSGGSPSGAIATLRGRLAVLYSAQKKFDDARANMKEVLRLRARLQQESGTVLALIFSSRIERAAKHTEAALKLSRNAKSAALQLVNNEDILAETYEAEADILVDKATDPNSLGLEQAIVGYKTAVEVYRRYDLMPLLARCLNSMGWAFERSGKFEEAEAAYTEAIKITESIQSGFATTSEAEAFGNMAETTEMYKRLVDLLVRQGRNEAALQFATRAQRKTLADAVPKNEIRLNGEAQVNLQSVANAENRIQAVRNKIDKSKGIILDRPQNNYVSALGSARQDYALAVKRLEREQPGLHFTVRPIDLLRLQSSVSATEAVVSYLITKEKIFVFIVKQSSVAVKTVEVGDEELLSLVAGVRTGLLNFANDFYAISMDPETGFAEEKTRPDLRRSDSSVYYKKNLEPIRRALVRLHALLIDPVHDLLKGVQTLKIIPNAELFLLPFTALLSPSDNQYLVEKHNIVFLTAGDLISPLTVTGRGAMVAFGNPAEAYLEGALEEVQAIQSVYPGAKVYTDVAATKSQLFKIKSARILHLATHGHILSPLESSNIQLAHLPDLADPDLTYGEIYSLPLESMEMVVLSACQTAMGTVSGTEIGVFIEAFRTKAKTVVASLWSVDDMSTKMLMTEFYKGLHGGKSRATAMRQAQLILLKDKRTKNPLFWSAFVMYGEGGKL